jgi:hypothetical protein
MRVLSATGRALGGKVIDGRTVQNSIKGNLKLSEAPENPLHSHRKLRLDYDSASVAQWPGLYETILVMSNVYSFSCMRTRTAPSLRARTRSTTATLPNFDNLYK